MYTKLSSRKIKNGFTLSEDELHLVTALMYNFVLDRNKKYGAVAIALSHRIENTCGSLFFEECSKRVELYCEIEDELGTSLISKEGEFGLNAGC